VIIPGADGFLRAVGPRARAGRGIDEARVVAGDEQFAFAGHESGQRTQQRRLARAIGADERHDLPALRGKGDAVEDTAALDLDGESEGADHELTHVASLRSR